jgi:single-stranded DNA-specific DHH superfamily exonuclease
MLTEKQILEIREHLDRAQNPIFYYDNDADGLCSFVLLRKYLDRGKGVAVRSFPDLNIGYARKAVELKSDYVFILDKPVLGKEFLEEIDKIGLPVVWIDHHEVPIEDYEKDFKDLFVYNPTRNGGDDKSSEPVTYLSYKISNRKGDVWLGVIGCIADHYLPDFVDEFEKKYPELWGKVKEPFDAYYGTGIGEIAVALNFGLKDSITNVVKLQNYLISCEGPESVFQESKDNYFFRKKYQDIKKKYEALLEKARECVEGKLLFFEYGGEMSISADIANQLSHSFKNKYIVVAYKKGTVANLSLRGNNIKKILEKVLEKVDGTGGGHEHAVGAQVKVEYLEKFKKAFQEEIDGEED